MAFGINSNIELIAFPIEELNGGIKNLFRAFPDNDIQLQLKDCNITNVIDNAGTIRITTTSPSALMVNGNKLTIVGGLYDGKTGTISNAASPTFDLDIDYIGDDATTNQGFINRLENNYNLEYRFVNSDTLDVQTSIPILTDNNFSVFNDIEGNFKINANLMKDLLIPTFDVIDSDNDSMNKVYQVQIREVESGASLGSWETVYDSALTTFEQFIICHATDFIVPFEINNKILDEDIESRIWRGYNKIVSYIASDATGTLSSAPFRQEEFTQDLTSLSVTNTTKDMQNGINYFTLSIIEDDSRFVNYQETTNASELNLTVYDTLQDDSEYYLTWLSEAGTFRSWLFNAVSTNELEYDKLTVEQLRFRDIPTQANRTVTLVTNGLSFNEFNYIQSMLATNLIQVENDGNTFECSVNSDTINITNKSDTYDFEFTLNIKPVNTMRV